MVKEMTKSYLRKIIAQTKDIMLHPSTEQMAEQETTVAKSPQSNLPIQQKKADHAGLRPEEKSKKRRIPFVALALAMVFTSLCTFALFGLQPPAFAKINLPSSVHLQSSASTFLDSPTPAANCTETNTCGQDGNPYNQLSTGEYAIVSTQPCIPHQNTDTSLSNVCESDQDYYWGNLDITCVDNPTCDAGMWGCSGGQNIVMRLYQATAAGATPNSPADSSGHNDAFTDSPEQISNTPVQLTNGTERVNTPGHGRQTKPSDKPSATNSSAVPLPPIYEVECTVSDNGLYFPCSDDKNGNINQMAIEKDWLSGNGLQANDDTANPVTGAYPAGHLSTTYDDDTTSSHLLQSLFSTMLALGYLMIAPIAILIGYQLLWASWTYQRATAMEDLGRLVLGIMAVAISFQLVTFMIGLTNLFNHAVILLHIELPYSSIGISQINAASGTYMLKGDTDPASFRGIVQPLVRWGCTANIFMGILTSKFATDLAGAITPFFGGMIKLFGTIVDAIDILKNIGNFAMLLLSISLCVQVYLRVLFINYYIVTAPVVFACWALPGGTGRKVMGQWLKGFVAVLLVQTVQLFVLTTMPLLLPPFPPIEAQGTGAWGLLNTLLNQLPGIFVLIATTQVPKWMGTGVTKAIAQAGTVAAGSVAAVAAAAYNTV